MTMMNARVHPLGRRISQLAGGLAALPAVLASQAAWAVNDLPGGPKVNQLNLHEPVTRIAAEQMWLHNMMLAICLAIFVAVFGVMFYSIFKHRKSRGVVPATFHESVTVEIAWTVVPFIIVILMALPATKVVVAMKDTTNADLTIKATGYQWKWGYDYLKGEGEGIGFLATLDAGQREMSDAGKPEGDNYLLKVDNPWSCRWARRCASSPRPMTSSTPGWCRPSASSRMPFPASCATPGSRPRRWATTTVSAPSSAARSMRTCPST